MVDGPPVHTIGQQVAGIAIGILHEHVEREQPPKAEPAGKLMSQRPEFLRCCLLRNAERLHQVWGLYVDAREKDRTVVGIPDKSAFGCLDMQVIREQSAETLGRKFVGAPALHDHAAMLAAEVSSATSCTRHTDADGTGAGLQCTKEYSGHVALFVIRPIVAASLALASVGYPRVPRVSGEMRKMGKKGGAMRTTIFLDHNVWDFLFVHQIDLLAEFPAGCFALAITREAEFEIAPSPSELQTFIAAEIARCSITVDPLFGWHDDRHEPADQRVGGFDVGRWASNEEAAFYASQQHRLHDPKRKTRLYKNEADIALGARAFSGVVLSLDSKPGPLRDALDQGGRVVFLDRLQEAPSDLGTAVKRHLETFAEHPPR